MLYFRKWIHLCSCGESKQLCAVGPDCAAFMTCWFCTRVNTSYLAFWTNTKEFVMDQYLLTYGNGKLPPHGQTMVSEL